MNKLYGFISLALGGSTTLLVLILTIRNVLNGNFVIGDMASLLIFALLISLFFNRAWRIFHNVIEIVCADSIIKNALFYLGGFLITISTIVFIINLTLVIQMITLNAEVAPIGIGVVFCIITYLIGALFIEICKKTHNKPLKRD